jgi:hypothetical protein
MTKSNSDSDYFDGYLRRKQLQTFTFSWLLPVLVKQETSLRLSSMPLVRDTSQHHSHLHHQLTPAAFNSAESDHHHHRSTHVSIGELHLFSDEAFPANPAIDHLQISGTSNLSLVSSSHLEIKIF